MTRSDMTRGRLILRWPALSFSLPPCGGGSGRGVAPNCDFRRDTPLPPMLRIVDLPHKGGANKNEGPS
jgi:hypothetical protein